MSDISEAADKLLEEMIDQQRKKVVEHARRLVPGLGFDDVLNPQDHPELINNPAWNYEDGILAGYLAAQIALRARVYRPEDSPP